MLKTPNKPTVIFASDFDDGRTIFFVSALARVNPGAAGGEAVWEVTPEKAVVKITKWSKVRDLSPQHMEDPIKEVAAMQCLCTRTQGGSPNIVGTLDVLSDEKYLYSFMPFCSGGIYLAT